ncbi:MAG: zinc ribbon domain-containing protein [Anaerolineae bacterium]
MDTQKRMARYDVRNDGIGPYAAFYCDRCSREYRSQPDVKGAIAQDLGRDAVGGLLRRIPLVGHSVAENVVGQDPRYVHSLTPAQLSAAWAQVEQYFRECPTCGQIVCLSDFDLQAGTCVEDSPRGEEIAEAKAEQAAGFVKGIANAFGISDVIRNATEAAKQASSATARCPNDGTVAPAGTKFCPECGTKMVQPSTDACPSCGKEAQGAKFCPECGTKIERPGPSVCQSCGTELQGAKFCPECGTRAS